MKTEVLSCDLCCKNYDMDAIGVYISGIAHPGFSTHFSLSDSKYCTKHLCKDCAEGIFDTYEKIFGRK